VLLIAEKQDCNLRRISQQITLFCWDCIPVGYPSNAVHWHARRTTHISYTVMQNKLKWKISAKIRAYWYWTNAYSKFTAEMSWIVIWDTVRVVAEECRHSWHGLMISSSSVVHLSPVVSTVATLRSVFLVLLDFQQRNYTKPLVDVCAIGVAFAGRLWGNVTSSTNLEVYNVLHCRQRRTQTLPNSTSKYWKFREVWRCGLWDIHVQAEIYTDMQTRSSQYFAHLPGVNPMK